MHMRLLRYVRCGVLFTSKSTYPQSTVLFNITLWTLSKAYPTVRRDVAIPILWKKGTSECFAVALTEIDVKKISLAFERPRDV